jgi:hypothetical protein
VKFGSNQESRHVDLELTKREAAILAYMLGVAMVEVELDDEDRDSARAVSNKVLQAIDAARREPAE